MDHGHTMICGVDIRSIENDDQPLFVARDIGEAFGYKNIRSAVRRYVSPENIKYHPIMAERGQRLKMQLITEAGLYELILNSPHKRGKQFKRWVTKDVLPTLRKYGTYNLYPCDKPTTYIEALKMALDMSMQEEKNGLVTDIKNIDYAKTTGEARL